MISDSGVEAGRADAAARAERSPQPGGPAAAAAASRLVPRQRWPIAPGPPQEFQTGPLRGNTTRPP